MSLIANKMMNAYGRAQVDSGVEAASPHKLIALLFDGALTAIANAKVHLEQGNIAGRGAAISKAIAIIDEGLKVSVDMDAGGELAQNLHALYEYMAYRLLEANLKADRRPLDEVDTLLKDLKGAWDSIGIIATQKTATSSAEPPKVAGSYGKA